MVSTVGRISQQLWSNYHCKDPSIVPDGLKFNVIVVESYIITSKYYSLLSISLCCRLVTLQYHMSDLVHYRFAIVVIHKRAYCEGYGIYLATCVFRSYNR